MRKLSENSFRRIWAQTPPPTVEFNYPKPGEEEQYTNTNKEILPAIKTENDKLIQRAKSVLTLVNDYYEMLGPKADQIVTVLQNFINDSGTNSSDLEAYYNSLSEDIENL